MAEASDAAVRIDVLAEQLAGTLGTLGQLVDGWGGALSARLDALEQADRRDADRLERVEAMQNRLFSYLDYLKGRAEAHALLVAEAHDDVPALAAQLARVRETDAYRAALDEREPLISVRIPTYNRPERLVDVAIASVLRQSYERLEVVVVSDGPSDENRRAVASVRDARVRYLELDAKTPYPVSARNRYLISGAAPANRGADEARGTWIACLDDDDEFSPDHLEVLLGHARATGAELVYGAMTQRVFDGAGVLVHEIPVYRDPPVLGGITMQAAMYLGALRFFRFDERSWLLDQPGDWHLLSRMLRAGVRVAGIDRSIGVLNSVPYWLKPEG